MNNDNTIDAPTNIKNLDIIGSTLTKYIRENKPIDPALASLIVILLAECRVYSVIRDSNLINDEYSEQIKDILTHNKVEDEKTVSDAADEIIADLRKNGINI
jgi:hypothetical protein